MIFCISFIVSIIFYGLLIYFYVHNIDDKLNSLRERIGDMFAIFILIFMLSGSIYILPLLDIYDIPSKMLIHILNKIDVAIDNQSDVVVNTIIYIITPILPIIAVYFSKEIYYGIIINGKKRKAEEEKEEKEKIAVKKIKSAYAITMIIAFFSLLNFSKNQSVENSTKLALYTFSPLCLFISTFVPLEIISSSKSVIQEIKDICYESFFGCGIAWIIVSIIFNVVFAVMINNPNLISDSTLLNILLGVNIPPIIIFFFKNKISNLKHSPHSS